MKAGFLYILIHYYNFENSNGESQDSLIPSYQFIKIQQK